MAKVSTGIDVTANDIRMVSLAMKGNRYQLVGYGMAAFSDTAAVKKLLTSPSFRRGSARFSIHDGMIKIHKITVPIVPKDELDEVIRWAIKEAEKTPLDGHTLRYYPLSGASENQQSYLTMAVERTVLQDYLIELQKNGIQRPSWVEPNVQALANCVNYAYEPQASERIAVIHMDASLAFFAIISSEGILFYRTFSRINGCAHAVGNMGQFFALLTVEIQYSCENYLEQFSNQSISSCILSGEGVNLPGIQQLVEETIELPTELLETFKNIELNSEQKISLADTAAHYSIALGLLV